ncbi:MAG: single-stranded DNA-binding protein [Deltaproteobacteria bacterium]
MAEGLNKAMLIGNLGAEPELRVTQNNRAVLKFRLATTESYGTETGERREVTHWHNCVLWGKRAEALSKILTKGMQVYVEGRIETRSYDDKDGVKKYATDINCTNLILLGRREGGGGGGGGPSGGGGGGGGYSGGGGGGGGSSGGGGGGGGGYSGGGGGRPRAPAAPAGGGGGRPPAGGDRDEIPPDDFGGGGSGGGSGGGDLGGSDDDIPF